MRLVFDIETNGLLYDQMDTIWCICAYDLDSKRWHVGSLQDGKIPEVIRLLSEADKIIGHNIVMYDIPAIQKLYPDFTAKAVDDTLICSRLFNSDRTGGHSLETYGKQFNIPKKPDLDWEVFSPEMVDRCLVDVEITTHLYMQQLASRSKWDWESALRLEYAISKCQAAQEKHGIFFDLGKAAILLNKLDIEIDQLSAELMEVLPLRAERVGTNAVEEPFKKNGDVIKLVADFFENDEEIIATVRGPFTRIRWSKYNLDSDTQIKQYLLGQAGWKPTQWNTKQIQGKTIRTSPQLTEDSYESIKGSIGKTLARRSILTHRRRTIKNYKNEDKGWINLLRRDGRLQAEGIPTGTPTARYRHKIVVNVPKAKPKIVYGKEMRELFTVSQRTEDGRKYRMVGCDAAQLEARMEAHYCYPYKGGKEYAHELLDGDIHAKNAAIFGTDRDGAKAPKYALTYGCRPPKLELLLGCSKRQAEKHWNNFWNGNTALNGFRIDLERALKKNRGFVKGLDGRKIRIRSPHSLVNSIIQSGGSICVKAATVWTFWQCQRKGIRAHLILHQHDEWQAEVHPDDIERYKMACLLSFVWVSRYYKLNVTLAGDVKVGDNWAECH